MTIRDVEIFTPLETAAGNNFRTRHGSKSVLVFLSSDREVPWLPKFGLLTVSWAVSPKSIYSGVIKLTA